MSAADMLGSDADSFALEAPRDKFPRLGGLPRSAVGLDDSPAEGLLGLPGLDEIMGPDLASAF